MTDEKQPDGEIVEIQMPEIRVNLWEVMQKDKKFKKFESEFNRKAKLRRAKRKQERKNRKKGRK
jgi:hypothetical protein